MEIENRSVCFAGSSLSSSTGREISSVKRYQLRLRPQEGLEALLESLTQSVLRFLLACPGRKDISCKEKNRFQYALKRVLERYVFAYKSCGSKRCCFEKTNPVTWNVGADFISKGVCKENMRILQIEVKKNLDEFRGALELVAFKTILQSWPGSEATKEDIHIGVRGVIKETFGPHLFKRLDDHCEVCVAGKRINIWELPGNVSRERDEN